MTTKIVLLLFSLALGSTVLTGCNTVQGAGKDVVEGRIQDLGRGAGAQEVLSLRDDATGAAESSVGAADGELAAARCAAHDFRAEFLPLLARARGDDRRPDSGRNPDIRHHGSVLKDLRFVAGRHECGHELRGLHAAVHHIGSYFTVRERA